MGGTGDRIRRAILPFLLFFGILAIGEVVVRSIALRTAADQRTQITALASGVRARIEGELNSVLFLANGLVGYVRAYPELDPARVETLMSQVFKDGRNLKNLGVAPGNKVTFIYPLKGNEAALKLDYRNNKSQWPSVYRAMETRMPVVNAPVNLVQGGRGIIERMPVFLEDGRYWGVISLVVDLDKFVASISRPDRDKDLKWALRGMKTNGNPDDMITGDPALFAPTSVHQFIEVPGARWELAAAPAFGWTSDPRWLWGLRLVSLVVAIVVAGLVYQLVSERALVRHLALHDPLTDLPNRRLLEDRLERTLALARRSGKAFTLLYLDLDDFKPINDRHGHSVGDRVLRELADRFHVILRDSDTIARVGGDEFIALLPETTSPDDVHGLVSRLRAAVAAEIHLDGLPPLMVGVSVGICRYPDDGATVDDLLHAADEAMYAAKLRTRQKAAN